MTEHIDPYYTVDQCQTSNALVLEAIHDTAIGVKPTSQQLVTENRMLRQQLEKAQAATETKTAFIAMMSHEVRTPLNAIMGLFELLEVAKLPDKQQNRARKGREAAEALFATLSTVLDSSKIEQAALTPDYHDTVIADLLRHADVALEGCITKYGQAITHRVEASQEVPNRITTDQTRAQQIISNLIDNAVRHTESGTISVTARIDPATPDFLAITVADTGAGIAASDMPRVFQAFEQVETGPMMRHLRGTGLGLSLSRDLARLLGGDLTVSSTLGRGSKFTLLLPLHQH